MKIALLTVFASMALGWLRAGGELDFNASLIAIPTFVLLVLILENLSAAKLRSGAIVLARLRESRKLIVFMLAVLSCTITVLIAPMVLLSVWDAITVAVFMPICVFQALTAASFVQSGRLFPKQFFGHIAVFAIGLLPATCIFSEIRTSADGWFPFWMIGIFLSIFPTFLLSLLMETVTSKLLGYSSELGSTLTPSMFITGLVVCILPILLSLNWSFEPGSLRECIRLCFAISMVLIGLTPWIDSHLRRKPGEPLAE